MKKITDYLVIAIDGSKAFIFLPENMGKAGTLKAPEWLVRQMGLPTIELEGWYLQPLSLPTKSEDAVEKRSQISKRLCLVRNIIAGAGRTPFDPRQARLRTERERLLKLNEESDYIRIQPLNVLPGSEPEHYKVTFICRGIVDIDSSRNPQYGDRHEVEIICDDDFPAEVPKLRWITPIWHPNIQHLEPKGVCVNKAEWLGGMGLDDLCRQMFEMVQYKNYHAEYSSPYPLDQDVARWVSEYAEPRNIVNKKRGIFIDDKPFIRPTVPRVISVVPQAPLSIKIVSQPAPIATTQNPLRIKLIGTSRTDEGEGPSSANVNRIKIIKSE